MARSWGSGTSAKASASVRRDIASTSAPRHSFRPQARGAGMPRMANSDIAARRACAICPNQRSIAICWCGEAFEQTLPVCRFRVLDAELQARQAHDVVGVAARREGQLVIAQPGQQAAELAVGSWKRPDTPDVVHASGKGPALALEGLRPPGVRCCSSTSTRCPRCASAAAAVTGDARAENDRVPHGWLRLVVSPAPSMPQGVAHQVSSHCLDTDCRTVSRQRQPILAQCTRSRRSRRVRSRIRPRRAEATQGDKASTTMARCGRPFSVQPKRCCWNEASRPSL